MQSAPDLTEDTDVYCYLANIYRYALLKYSDNRENLGLNVFDYRLDQNFLLSESQYEPNNMYHQTFEGFQNMSFLGVPLFISKNHFYSCPENWTKLVHIST